MAQFPMLPLWTDAYLGDTHHLTTIEHGAYLLLLMAMWRAKNTRLPKDDKMLARYARLTPAQWARMKPTVMRFFIDHGDEISQSRLTDEANAVKRNSKRQSDKAKARWLSEKETADAQASPGQCRSDASLPTPLPTESPNGDMHDKPQAASSATHRPKRSKRGTRLQSDWMPSEANREYARCKGFSDRETAFQAERFVNFWTSKPGQAGVKLDWDATWRNWLLSEVARSEPAKRGPAAARKSNTVNTPAGEHPYADLLR